MEAGLWWDGVDMQDLLQLGTRRHWRLASLATDV